MSAVPSGSKPIDDPRVYLAAERRFSRGFGRRFR